MPKVMFGIQNIIFRFLPKSVFETMAFDKKDTFALGSSMKNLGFQRQSGRDQVPCADPLRGERPREREIGVLLIAEY